MSAQPIQRVDLELVEALDFEHVPPCEHSQHIETHPNHDGDAYALVRLNHSCVGEDVVYLCEPFVRRVTGPVPIKCARCKEPLNGCYSILALVGEPR